jgi:electron transport complex protein RnfG
LSVVNPNSLRPAIVLAAFATLCTALLVATFSLTRERIVQAEDHEKLLLVNEILPPAMYDNRILQDSVKLAPSRLLGTNEATTAYRARLKGKASAFVFEAVASDGYGGKIRVLLSVASSGELLGVRVIAHNETPGWGDYIESTKSPWIRMFEGTSLARFSDAEWQVKKDGGRFDYVARATVSARAVVGAVHRGLQFYAAHAGAVYDPQTHLVR